jgi:hypothetical protein
LIHEECTEFERFVVPILELETRARAHTLFGEAETLVGFKTTLLHADLGPEHLLVRGSRLAGVDRLG